jgi:hypothetical protein
MPSVGAGGVGNDGGCVRNGSGHVRNAGGGGAPLCTPVNKVPLCCAELSKNIHSLVVLWTEYAVSLGGSKPARGFSAHEHGLKCNKFAFSHSLQVLLGVCAAAHQCRYLFSHGHQENLGSVWAPAWCH